MTSPGHVFMAFDTGEPEQNGWLFESETTSAIAYGGTVWLPYETTILAEGFLASWEEGSRLYKRHAAAGEIEFIPIASERTRFPALPLDPASFAITAPAGLDRRTALPRLGRVASLDALRGERHPSRAATRR